MFNTPHCLLLIHKYEWTYYLPFWTHYFLTFWQQTSNQATSFQIISTNMLSNFYYRFIRPAISCILLISVMSRVTYFVSCTTVKTIVLKQSESLLVTNAKLNMLMSGDVKVSLIVKVSKSRAYIQFICLHICQMVSESYAYHLFIMQLHWLSISF